MPKLSAGLLMYRLREGGVEVLLVHPGGPIWAKKNEGAWSIPKGEVETGEDPLSTAKREFEEELGFAPEGKFIKLQDVKQKGGKTVQAWAFEGNCEPSSVRSNTFLMEWPPRSGNKQEFPEVDRAEFFEMMCAKQRINPAQAELLSELERLLESR
jgi:predicted NUDIX family NTP pyrophosphohydrolase